MVPYYVFVSNANYWGLDYPYDTTLYVTDEIFGDIAWAQEDFQKRISKTYDIQSWLAVNQITNFTWQEWLDMPFYIKEAIKGEVELIVQKREGERRQREWELERRAAEAKTKFNFDDLSKTNIGSLFSK